MPMYTGKSHESGTLKPNVSPCQQKSPSEKGRPEVFTVGNWDQFNEWWGSDDDEDTFTEDIHEASSPSPSPSSVRVVNSSEADEWLELDHEDADPASEQPGSLTPDLEATFPSETSSSSSSSEPESGLDSDSDPSSTSEFSDLQREQEVVYAQRLLVNRALYPQRRDSLLPYRKTIIIDPTPLKIQANGQCPQCQSTTFRMISEHCLPCTMDKVRSTIEDLELNVELIDDEYMQETRRMSDRKCAIEDEHPDDYMDDTEWQDLKTEHVELSEDRIEKTTNLEGRLAELAAQMSQYNEWMEEDLAKYR
ncbi:MAG: hypothetical protein Q9195_002872 [Heterodermia aff. obscurata]